MGKRTRRRTKRRPKKLKGGMKKTLSSSSGELTPSNFYQSAFNILDSDGPNPLYVLYEK